MKGTIIDREEVKGSENGQEVILKIRILIETEKERQDWYSCFDRNLFLILKTGNVIEFSFTDSGKYKNVISATLFITGRQFFHEKQDKILKSMCLKIAGSQTQDSKMMVVLAQKHYAAIKESGWMEGQNESS